MRTFENTFDGSHGSNAEKLLNEGAVIIDVRTPAEFQGGHVAGSRNIPLNLISNRVYEIKALGKPVVLCCASGNRSGQAAAYLKQNGVNCENGGGWMQVKTLVGQHV